MAVDNNSGLEPNDETFIGSGFVPNSLSSFITDDNAPDSQPRSIVKEDVAYNETLLNSQGAMSDTYRRTLDTGKIEIVKRIKAKYKDDKTYMRLFVQEYSNLDGLNNENIVRTYNFGKDDRGLWYSMEYVDGKTLTDIINNNLISGIKDKTDILRQILNALVYIHDKGLIHRDLKPDNVMVSNKNRNVKIIDFGLAVADAFEDKLRQAGTPKYMSPEQRINAKEIDKRSDIYAFGVIMREFLTDKYANIPQYRNIIEKCLRNDKSERYQNCTDILNDLKEKNRTLSPEIRSLILDIVDDGVVTPAEEQRLKAGIVAENLDEDLVYREMEYQLEKVLERKKLRKKILIAILITLLAVAAVLAVFHLFNNSDNEPPKPVNDTVATEQPLPLPEPEPLPAPESEPMPENNLPYGYFSGRINEGNPDGYGTLIYTDERLLNRYDDQKRKALPGDRVEGLFKDGNLVNGTITHTDGRSEVLIIGI